MIIEMLMYIVGFYFFSAISVYLYAVAKTYEAIGCIAFEIDESHIGVCKYPKWLLGWMYWIIKKIRGGRK